MKTKDYIKSDSTLMKELREIRDKLSLEMIDMSLTQIKDYLQKQETLHPSVVWEKKRI